MDTARVKSSRAGSASTVGMLYPGELGAAFAKLLIAKGMRVVTTLSGRSEPTARACRQAELVVLDSLADVARESRVVFCMVSPRAAEEVADEYCTVAKLAPASAVYVDANSIGPEQVTRIADKVVRAGCGFVDAAVNGLARNLATGGTLFLSGRRADDVAALVGDAMRVRVLGEEPGRASTMKMLLGGLSKGACALYLELACLARQRGMLPEMLDACGMIYPGIQALIDRMLPTYARHADRRATEMAELEQTAQASGMQPCVIDAILRLHEQVAGLAFDPGAGPGEWTAAGLIESAGRAGLLAEKRGVEPSNTQS